MRERYSTTHSVSGSCDRHVTTALVSSQRAHSPWSPLSPLVTGHGPLVGELPLHSPQCYQCMHLVVKASARVSAMAGILCISWWYSCAFPAHHSICLPSSLPTRDSLLHLLKWWSARGHLLPACLSSHKDQEGSE